MRFFCKFAVSNCCNLTVYLTSVINRLLVFCILKKLAIFHFICSGLLVNFKIQEVLNDPLLGVNEEKSCLYSIFYYEEILCNIVYQRQLFVRKFKQHFWRHFREEIRRGSQMLFDTYCFNIWGMKKNILEKSCYVPA